MKLKIFLYCMIMCSVVVVSLIFFASTINNTNSNQTAIPIPDAGNSLQDMMKALKTNDWDISDNAQSRLLKMKLNIVNELIEIIDEENINCCSYDDAKPAKYNALILLGEFGGGLDDEEKQAMVIDKIIDNFFYGYGGHALPFSVNSLVRLGPLAIQRIMIRLENNEIEKSINLKFPPEMYESDQQARREAKERELQAILPETYAYIIYYICVHLRTSYSDRYELDFITRNIDRQRNNPVLLKNLKKVAGKWAQDLPARYWTLSEELLYVVEMPDSAEKAEELVKFLLPRTNPDEKNSYTPIEPLIKMDKYAVSAIVDLIENSLPDDDLNDAVLILYHIGANAKPAVPVLCKLLNSPEKASPWTVLNAIGSIGDPLAIEYVRPFLHKKETAAYAAVTLGKLRDKDSFEDIEKLITTPLTQDQHTVRDILNTLYDLDKEKAMPVIEKVINDPKLSDVRNQIKGTPDYMKFAPK